MNDRKRMRIGTYIMYHDINWFHWKQKCWVRYDNLRGKPPKHRWKRNVNRGVQE